ncbi:helix-turn-helix transcriptional regulator [Streptomyces sp. NBC_01465]|uniref:helix-turn-helix transcriptional regulator n=1 Tax=Streptomyces sp. NBC_01465 TaxID=2903878 RepID=UPI002E370964|nr:LuxR C-terminal-related transcriptional regulator [Streptomyces sp. NBC_01465]
MHYPAAGAFLRSALPDIIRTYQYTLRTVRSPLVTHPEAWPRCRDQAQAIVEDCIAALAGQPLPEPSDARSYSHQVGTDRAQQGIAVAESVRAVDVLWSALQPALRTAVQYEASARRTAALLLVSTVFRTSAGQRLYAGARGYDAVAAQSSRVRAPASPGTGQTAEHSELSRREREILERVALARTNVQIARELGIETATVKRHLCNIYGKLQAGSRIDAVNKAFGRV